MEALNDILFTMRNQAANKLSKSGTLSLSPTTYSPLLLQHDVNYWYHHKMITLDCLKKQLRQMICSQSLTLLNKENIALPKANFKVSYDGNEVVPISGKYCLVDLSKVKSILCFEHFNDGYYMYNKFNFQEGNITRVVWIATFAEKRDVEKTSYKDFFFCPG
jgi:hypothetical protein